MKKKRKQSNKLFVIANNEYIAVNESPNGYRVSHYRNGIEKQFTRTKTKESAHIIAREFLIVALEEDL